MNIYYTESFRKNYKKRISQNDKLVRQFKNRKTLFKKDPTNIILQDHSLKAVMTGFRAFSVTGNIRVIYYTQDSDLYFVDIGTHNQVY